jgi:short-subunit dehydrogenase
MARKHHIETSKEVPSRHGFGLAPAVAVDQFKARYGPWALVTGASAGIGAEFARQLAGKGLNLILVARRAELLDALAEDLMRAHGVEVRTIAVDLSGSDFLDAIRDVVEDVDVGLLVNNAGTAVGGSFLDTELEPQRRSVELNVLAPLLLAHQLGRHIRTRGRGGIIFLSSPMALQGVANWANFAATKSYDLTLAEGLAGELESQGIDVLSVLPGPTLTEGTVNMGARANRGPMKFKAPEGVVAETLASLGKTSTVVPGWMNRLMNALMKCLSRSARTKLWGKMMAAMGMPDEVISSPQVGEKGSAAGFG